MAFYFGGDKHRISVSDASFNAKVEQIKSGKIISNGTYKILPDNGCTLSKVEIEVNVKDGITGLDLRELTITKNGEYSPNNEFDGYSSVVVNVPIGEVDCSHIIESGSCGNYVTYDLYDSNILHIKGSGSTSNYNINTRNSPFTRLSPNIKYVIIGEGITSIGDCLFTDCSNLINIAIPNSVTSIGSNAFYGSGITNISIPDSITRISESAFKFCNKLTDVVLPNSIITIETAMFSYCSKLNNIIIPNGVTSILTSAFSGVNITHIELPSGLTSINSRIFQDCASLSSITIPKTVTKIESSAFNNTSLETIYYKGSQSDWNNISITSGYDEIFNANVYSEQTTLTMIK